MSKNIIAAIFAAFAVAGVFIQATYAGNCDHDWQTASDGSRCGGRSADSQAGGQSN